MSTDTLNQVAEQLLERIFEKAGDGPRHFSMSREQYGQYGKLMTEKLKAQGYSPEEKWDGDDITVNVPHERTPV